MEKLIIVIYFAILLSVNFVRKWNPKGAASYLLAGRKVTLLPFVATIVSTGYGWVLGVGEMYYEYGISAWLVLSLPYTIFALLLALFFARRARSFGHITIADLLHQKFGRPLANVGAVILLLVNSPAMYLLMAGQVIAFVWGIEIEFAIATAALFASVYLYRGGFTALLKTDVLQFFWMFAAFVILLIVLWSENGAPSAGKLPEGHMHMSFSGSYWDLIAWFLLAAFTFIDPNYYQRMSSTDRPATAKTGLVIAVGCWTVFDFLMASVALYGVAHFPELDKPEFVFLEVGQMAFQNSPFMLGVFYVGLLSTIMSTADSMIFYAGISISRDLLHGNNLLTYIPVEKLTRIGLVLVTILGTLIAILYSEDSVVDLFFDLHPLAVSALLIPILLAYQKRSYIDKEKVILISGLGICVWLVWTIGQSYWFVKDGLLSKINAIYPGVIVTVSMFLLFSLLANGKRKNS